MLRAAGIGPDSKVALYGYNSNEYLEVQFGVFKARGVPVNVNYRYVEHELLYLLDNADAEAVVFDAQFAPRLAAIRDRLPELRLFLQIDDGSGEHLPGAVDFEGAVASGERLAPEAHSEDDIYMLYTGGTTGMPKGVMYRQGDFISGLVRSVARIGPDSPLTAENLTAAIRALEAAHALPVSLAACPLMHGTGLWLGVFAAHFVGGTALTSRDSHFDPDVLFRLVAKERATSVVIVGDAFAKPMLAALRRAAAA